MIWKSAEFLTLLVDILVSTAFYFGAKYLAPEAFEDVKWVIAALQPLVLFLIAWFAVERAAKYIRTELARFARWVNR